MRKLTILAALLLLVPAMAKAKTLDDLLVEKGVITKAEQAGVAKPGAAAPSKVYWNKGTRVDFPEQGFSSTIYTKIRARYDYTDNDDDSGLDDVSSFNVDRFRLGVVGTALNSEFEYKAEAELGGTTSARATDVYLQWNACDWGSLRMGQWKTPISRQYNTSFSLLQFVDRTVVSNLASFGRQNGAGVKTKLMDDQLELGATIVNGRSTGEGQDLPGNDNKVGGFVQARYAAMGEQNPYEESDVAQTKDAALSIGAAYGFEKDAFYEEDVDITDDHDIQALSVDTIFKLEGFSLALEYFWKQSDPELSEKSTLNGGYVQLGYFLAPKEVELAARYGIADCDDGRVYGECIGNKTINQATAGLNYYWWGQHLKAQLNYDFVQEDAVEGAKDTNTNKYTLALASWW